jgi:3-methylfumaryl-CoA hydratase
MGISSDSPVNLEHLRSWIGRTEMASDVITQVPMTALSATLECDDPPPRLGDAVPPLWTWMYFLPIHRMSELGYDGHVERGGFLPPVSLPRRMIAGGNLSFFKPLRVGDEVSRTSRIVEVSYKEGRSGPLVFVRIAHEISLARDIALVEEQEIVYRGLAKPNNPAPVGRRSSSVAQWSRDIHPDEVLLFRYSALTFNGHRIHYDQQFTVEEGYPGLIVHGPLIATLLADVLRRNHPTAIVREFRFRSVRPIFNTGPFTVAGCLGPDQKSAKLWALDQYEWLAMEADVTIDTA